MIRAIFQISDITQLRALRDMILQILCDKSPHDMRPSHKEIGSARRDVLSIPFSVNITALDHSAEVKPLPPPETPIVSEIRHQSHRTRNAFFTTLGFVAAGMAIVGVSSQSAPGRPVSRSGSVVAGMASAQGEMTDKEKHEFMMRDLALATLNQFMPQYRETYKRRAGKELSQTNIRVKVDFVDEVSVLTLNGVVVEARIGNQVLSEDQYSGYEQKLSALAGY